MRSMDRRVRKLETRLSSPENEAARSLVALLMARKRRYAVELRKESHHEEMCRPEMHW
jgi:hypothetical protein